MNLARVPSCLPRSARGIISSLLLLQSVPAAPGAEFQAGAAQVKITPPLGVPLAGYYHARGAEAVHDDLYSRALVLETAGEKAALVSLDLISTRREWVERARTLIEDETGIPSGNVMISATHAHTGPVLPTSDSGDMERDEPNPAALKFSEQLPRLIAQSVREAYEGREPARVSAAAGREETLAFNRRYHMRDGSVGWNPGKGNPGILKPAGPVDPQAPVVHFETSQRRPLATYVNYAVHLDNVGGSQISADLPFTLSDCLARVLGQDHVTLWTAGCCGDVNHVDVNWPVPQKGHANAARMGIVLAGEVLRTWPRLAAARDAPLQVRQRTVELPLAPIDESEVEAARLTVQGTRDSDPGGFMKLVQAHKLLDVHARRGKPLEAEVQVISLGDSLAWVSLPGEIFVQLGLDLKLDSPFPQTMIATLANGSLGYIPNRRAYPQGNYEVVSARCAAGSGELLVQAAVEMLKELHPIASSALDQQ